MKIEERPYQDQMIADARNACQQYKAFILYGPTGCGKTNIAARMLGKTAERFSCLFVVHRKELVGQTSSAFRNLDIKHGIIASNQPEMPHHNLQICMVQTLVRRLHKVRIPKLIVWDEAHHCMANTYRKIFNTFPDAIHIGLTASPIRTDSKSLGDLFQHIVLGPSVSELIAQGYLCDYKLYAPVSINTKGAREKFGEYNHEDIEAILDKSTIVGDSIATYKSLANGKKGIAFCHSIKASKLTCQAFNDAGINSAHIDGEMPSWDRDRIVQNFRDDKITLLFNVAIAEEGFDIANAEVLLDLSPTKSLARALQRYGRVLRPSKEKTHAIIIDHTGNSLRHGLPDDQRSWDLNAPVAKKRKSKDSEPANMNFRICPKCFASNPLTAISCKECKAELPRQEREIEQVEGTLAEVDKAARKVISPARVEQANAQTMEELIAVGVKLGHKNPTGWAYHIMKARQNKYGRK